MADFRVLCTSALLWLACCLSLGLAGCEKSPERLSADLREAIRDGDLAAVQALLRDGADANGRVGGDTPLHAAAFHRRTEIVKALLAAGADVRARSDLQFTPLHSAGFRGKSTDNDVARPLIAAGADLNARDKRERTPLHVATETGNLGVVRDLVAAGADINARSDEGETALHVAARTSEFGIIKLLVAAGADVSAKTNRGESVLSIAKAGADLYPWSRRRVEGEIFPYLQSAGAM